MRNSRLCVSLNIICFRRLGYHHRCLLCLVCGSWLPYFKRSSNASITVYQMRSSNEYDTKDRKNSLQELVMVQLRASWLISLCIDAANFSDDLTEPTSHILRLARWFYRAYLFVLLCYQMKRLPSIRLPAPIPCAIVWDLYSRSGRIHWSYWEDRQLSAVILMRRCDYCMTFLFFVEPMITQHWCACQLVWDTSR